MPKVQGFYKLLAQKFQAEAAMATQWIQDKHWGAVGVSREAVLRRYLVSYLPQRFACGTGFIVGQRDDVSRQCDLLIYDRHEYEPLFVDDDFVIVRADAVKLVIEAKSEIDETAFGVALNNIRCAKKLHTGIRGAVFGLSGCKKAATAKRWLESISKLGVPESDAKNPKRARLPPSQLADFVHLANGLQLYVPPDARQTDSAMVLHRAFDSQEGTGLLYFWDWILKQCRTRERGDEAQYLASYMGVQEPQWKELLNYQ
jgi:hypothetical protein